MFSLDVERSGEPEPEIVWYLRDQQSLERDLEHIYGDAPGGDAWLKSVIETFVWRLQSHPREWPTASAPPSDHTFRFYGVEIRYRVFPSHQEVDVLSVTSLAPRQQ